MLSSRRIAPLSLAALVLAISVGAGIPLAHSMDKGGDPQSSASDAQGALPTFGRKKDKRQPTAEENASEGTAFLAENAKSPTSRRPRSGLQYQVVKEGTGRKPRSSETVKVNYVEVPARWNRRFDEAPPRTAAPSRSR